ncbi:MAG: hypothetical protein ABW151_17835 [Pseudorhodoplanes sp.]
MTRWNLYFGAVVIGAAVLGSMPAANAATASQVRAAAIHQCSVASQRYPETTFSSLEFELYRACMADRGQVE